jgi:hypothetical protein
MKQYLASLGAVLIVGTSVHGQPQIGSYSQPVVNPRPIISPYLNLNQGSANPAINYYGIVRPQIENRQAIQNLQQQAQTTQGMIQGQAGPSANEDIAPTGRTMGGYLNYSHYFPLYSRGAGGSSAPAGNGARR